MKSIILLVLLTALSGLAKADSCKSACRENYRSCSQSSASESECSSTKEACIHVCNGEVYGLNQFCFDQLVGEKSQEARRKSCTGWWTRFQFYNGY